MALADSPFISEARQEDNDWNDKSSAWLFCRILNNQREKLSRGVARVAAHQFLQALLVANTSKALLPGILTDTIEAAKSIGTKKQKGCLICTYSGRSRFLKRRKKQGFNFKVHRQRLLSALRWRRNFDFQSSASSPPYSSPTPQIYYCSTFKFADIHN